MKLVFSDQSWSEYLFWQENDKQLLKRINKLIKEIQRDSHNGIGKPEPLRHQLSGYWSRRITEEHRIVYAVVDDSIWIVKLKNHYSD